MFYIEHKNKGKKKVELILVALALWLILTIVKKLANCLAPIMGFAWLALIIFTGPYLIQYTYLKVLQGLSVTPEILTNNPDIAQGMLVTIVFVMGCKYLAYYNTKKKV